MNRKKYVLIIGSDHAGYDLKEYVKQILAELQYEIVDMGTDSKESVDYPDYAEKVAVRVSNDPDSLGILACATGVGISIAANKIRGIRAALVSDEQTARLSREHNDANILVLAGKNYDSKKIRLIVMSWLDASFEGGRHERRVRKISALEEKNNKDYLTT